ncbi:MAG: hypothetical protein SGPRY_001661, partial [Prymnesium sp.]
LATDAQDRLALERMLRMDETSSAPPQLEEGGVLRDVALWRVQWSLLPGFNQLLNVHVPHYTNMFSQLALSDPKVPRLFGHLLLPGGSKNLRDPRYALGQQNSQAPTIGTLMHMRAATPMPDGRLQVEAHAICTFEEIPCWRADLRLLLDEEEIDVMLAHIARHEIEERTSALVSSRREKCAEVFLREMRERGLRRLVCLERELSVRRQRACAAACASAFVWSTREAAPRVDMQSQLIGLDLRPDKVFVQALSEEASCAAITSFAGETEAMNDQLDSHAEVEASASSVGTLDTDEFEEDADTAASVSSRLLLLQEQRVWVELMLCLDLSRQIRAPSSSEKSPPIEVPSALLQLLPPPPAEGWPACAPRQTATVPSSFPPTRRAQRFSFQVAALLPDLDLQVLLEMRSTSARLQAEVETLVLLRARRADLEDDDGYPSATG